MNDDCIFKQFNIKLYCCSFIIKRIFLYKKKTRGYSIILCDELISSFILQRTSQKSLKIIFFLYEKDLKAFAFNFGLFLV